MKTRAGLPAMIVALGALAAMLPGARGQATKTQAASAPAATRTRAEVGALIEKAGTTPPEWWDDVTLKYPPTLDLTWTVSGRGGKWDNQKHLSQYLWDIINPNPARWKEGVKLVHQALAVNKNDPAKRTQSMERLADMYCYLLQDYARAAYWARKCTGEEVLLARCYWRLGSKEMAVEILNELVDDPTNNGEVIRLWGEMGEIKTALEVAGDMVKNGRAATGHLAAGDVCRSAGRYTDALKYYEKVLAVPDRGRGEKMFHNRARASIEAIKMFDSLDLSRLRDGVYKGSAQGYVAPMEVAVKVSGGRIESVTVTSHKEKQYYNSISETTAQIVQKQGLKGIDATSGATITSEAIISATGKALTAK